MPRDPTAALDPLTYAIVGCALEVHRILGAGFLEAVYRDALHQLLSERMIPVRSEVELPIRFRGRRLRTAYRADLVCYDEVLVELKALSRITGTEHAQVLNYLKASGLNRALLINFGGRRLEIRRFVGAGAPSVIPSVSSVDAFVGPEAPSVSSMERPSLPLPKV